MANNFNPVVRFVLKLLVGGDIRILRGEQIDDAKRLLYEVYHLEQKWVPVPGNHSGLELKNGKLEDSLAGLSTWIGLYKFSNGEYTLAGVTRVLSQLELVRYLDEDKKARVGGIHHPFEANRVAVRKQFRGAAISVALSLACRQLGAQRGFRTIVAGVDEQLLTMFSRIGMRPMFSFRYNVSEPKCHFITGSAGAWRRLLLVLLIIRLRMQKLYKVVSNRIFQKRLTGV